MTSETFNMKKILKMLGIGLLVVAVMALAVFLFVNSSPIPSYEVKEIAYQVDSSPESIERGKKLTTMLCAGCHINRETGKLTRTLMKDAPLEFGEVYSQNITQDNEFGIGAWTDAQLMYLLRTGIKKDGQYAPPYMAKLPLTPYSQLTDEEAGAIYDYLRTIPPIQNKIKRGS